MRKRKTLWKILFCFGTVFSLLLTSLGATVSASTSTSSLEAVTLDPDAMYNGIVVPENWDYTLSPYGDVVEIPYLKSEDDGGYAPEIINIDVGRQLFVDDFLIDSTTLDRYYYQATLNETPVLTGKPEDGGSAVLTSGGVWYDMDEKLYKMWYQAGFAGQMAYATSTDGINWELPRLSGGNGSNEFLRSIDNIGGSSVWLDYNADESERYKLMIRQSDSTCKLNGTEGDGKDFVGLLYTSADGVRWVPKGETGLMGDRTTFFYNELLDKWVFSIRYNTTATWGYRMKSDWCRTRAYHEGDTWLEAADWDWWESDSDNNPLFWQKTDTLDPIDKSQGDDAPQMYNFDAICYESITLGLYQIWYGPENNIISQTGKTKITEIQAAYSRDGFYFDRPVRGAGNALISASRTEGTWDYGYLSTATGGIIVLDNEIRIYYSAISNSYESADGQTVNGPYYGGSIGYASLRRDGFASMDGTGELLTKPLTVTKDVKYLFVNANVSNGSLKAEILDTKGNVVEGYSAADCVAMTTDSCCTKLAWNGADDLSFLQNKGFRIRFIMEEGELYSFWLSADPEGASGGSVAAGYAGTKDLNPDLSQSDDGTNDTDTTDINNGEKSGCSSAVSSVAIVLPVLAGVALCKREKHLEYKCRRKEKGLWKNKPRI